MKEISITDKAELSKLQKQFKEVSNQLTEISEGRDKLENDLQVWVALMTLYYAFRIQSSVNVFHVRASASQPVGRGFEPQPSHTKDF